MQYNMVQYSKTQHNTTQYIFLEKFNKKTIFLNVIFLQWYYLLKPVNCEKSIIKNIQGK